MSRTRHFSAILLRLILSLTLLLSLLFGNFAQGETFHIQWSPKEITQTLRQGESSTLNVTFTSDINLSNVKLWVVPELQPFISVSPEVFSNITAGIKNSTTLTITVPVNTEPGIYDGTLHLRVGNKTYPQTLKILLEVKPSTHIVEFLTVNPDGIFVNEPTLVTITIQIVADPDLIPSDIRLLRLDENNVPIATLSLLHDDGSNGDALAGDGTFTSQVEFNESNLGQIRLRVSVPYTSPPNPVLSDILTVTVVEPDTEESFNAMLDTQQEGYEQFVNLSQIYGAERARQMTVDWLRTRDGVGDAGISVDGKTIWIDYESGTEGSILTGPIDTQGEGGLGSTVASSHTQVTSPLSDSSVFPESNEAIVLSPFLWQFHSDDEWVGKKLSQTGCIKYTFKKDSEVTVDLIKTIDQYGVVFIDTHGGVRGWFSPQVILLTGEKVTSWWSHRWDRLMKRLVTATVGGETYFAIKPSFIRKYAEGSYPKSLIYVGACDSLENATMANAFLEKGAATYFGFEKTIYTSFDKDMWTQLFTKLVDNKMTTKQAFDSIANKIDPTPYLGIYGQFVMKGNPDLLLPRELVTNGGFETGNFSGWVTGFTLGGDFPQYACPGGYAAVISGNATEGTYAARLGRWDQFYTGGLYGPPTPYAEPSGYDWMYQDVELPPNSHKTLTFSYNVQTFDTAEWDWFDVYIKDPDTSANLVTVVNRAGKPGTTYGEYWNGGWQNVSFDLSSWAGRKIRLWFGNRQDGWGDQNVVFVDNVSIKCE